MRARVGRSDMMVADGAVDANCGLAWGSAEVTAFQALLPSHQRLVPLTELSGDARANLRACLEENGWDPGSVDEMATADVALQDMRTIVDELSYLPPLCPPRPGNPWRRTKPWRASAPSVPSPLQAADSASPGKRAPSASARRTMLQRVRLSGRRSL